MDFLYPEGINESQIVDNFEPSDGRGEVVSASLPNEGVSHE